MKEREFLAWFLTAAFAATAFLGWYRFGQERQAGTLREAADRGKIEALYQKASVPMNGAVRAARDRASSRE